ncbi:MAG: 23S rRNA (guanosine(2251)-2'-O)-methyltransferase RlmB, partial [Cyclobacteriaceae bacterium]|nr:23S rRNA (guanosine(2251)-2'-O)-methyltransferase RlmB [Cyclobacteriaceae bacterium]
LIYDADLKGPLAIILGSEEDGISPEYLKLCDELVKIPLAGKIESLNVSVSAGVILYEALRQQM